MDFRLSRLDGLLDRPSALYEQRGWWGQQPLWARVRDQARVNPDKHAVIDDTASVTYGELWSRALRCRAALRAAGVGRRDIILVQLPNWHEFATLAVAAETLSAVLAFCPIQWGLRETVRALELIRPSLWFTTAAPRPGDDRSGLIAEAGGALAGRPPVVLIRSSAVAAACAFEDWLSEAVPRGSDDDGSGGSGSDLLEIAVTSGTTGDPKGVLHTHDSATSAVESTNVRQRIGPDDVVYVAVPVGHTFGYFYGVRCALQSGATLVLREHWDANAMVDHVERHGVTVSLGPSAFALDLLNLDARQVARLSRLRLFTLAGDSLPVPVARRAVERLPFRISRALGMTEFGHATATDETTPLARCIDSLGTPQPEMDVRIADDGLRPVPAGSEGKILMRGPFLFAGYLTPDALNQEVLDGEGFFDTGDLGYIDEDGCLHLTGRVKNVIRRGAETIPVSLIEDIIAMHPDVRHAIVVGVPDPRLGEIPVACVQTRGGKDLSLEDIVALLSREGVTKKFWPANLRIFEEWPIGPTGKIDRRRIVAAVLDKTATP